MKYYSEYQGDRRTCLNCIFIEYDDDGDHNVGIYCEKDEDGVLDIENEAGEIASRCPFWKSLDRNLSILNIIDIETKGEPEIYCQIDLNESSQHDLEIESNLWSNMPDGQFDPY